MFTFNSRLDADLCNDTLTHNNIYVALAKIQSTLMTYCNDVKSDLLTTNVTQETLDYDNEKVTIIKEETVNREDRQIKHEGGTKCTEPGRKEDKDDIFSVQDTQSSLCQKKGTEEHTGVSDKVKAQNIDMERNAASKKSKGKGTHDQEENKIKLEMDEQQGNKEGESVEGDNTYSHLCNQCGRTYSNKYILQRHLSRAHNIRGIDTHYCEICRRIFKSLGPFEKHKKKHESCSFVCKKCGEAFPDVITLRKHSVSKHKISHCKQCDATFLKYPQLRVSFLVSFHI